MSYQKKAKLVCQICQEGATQTCPNCNSFNYCNDEHRRQHHRSGHGAKCKPVKAVKVDKDLDKLTVTRDIQQGETIFKQKPILLGPGYPEYYFLEEVPPMKICLGCYREVQTDAHCSKCKWPVCSKKCENDPWHKNFECRIIAKKKIPFKLEYKERYYHITILRVLLLKYKKPETWEKIIGKIDYYVKNSKSEYYLENAKYVAQTLKKDFHLGNLNLDIGKVQGVVRMLDSYGITGQHSYDMAATCLFESVFHITFDCIPNAYAFLGRDRRGEIVSDLWAVLPISIGESVTRTHNFHLTVLGTSDRRLRLMEHYEYICKCQRCSDPTELGSYFSAFKCEKKSCSGYLLPRTPLNSCITSPWNCNTCRKPKNISYSQLKNNFDKRLDALSSKLVTKAKGPLCGEKENVFVRIRRYDTILQVSQAEIHFNHHSVWRLKESFMEDLREGMETCAPDIRIDVATDLLTFSTEFLELSNMVVPGLTPFRGRIMYYVTKASRCLIECQSTNERNPYVQGIVDRMEKVALNILQKFYRNYLFAGEEMITIMEDLEDATTSAMYDGIANLFIEDEVQK